MDTPSILAFLGFLAAVALVASSGIAFRPGAWYERLEKPAWTPPNRAFPIVWSILYLTIAASGWLVWREVGLRPLPFAIYAAQLMLNFLWSALFFGLRRPGLALLDVAALALLVAANILVFRPLSPVAAWLLVPYLAWIGVAAALNLSVWRRNRGRGVFAGEAAASR